VEPLDVLAWIVAAVRPDLTVPLTDDPEVWSRGVESGHRVLWLMRRDGDRPKLPGGRRPYVRAPLPSRPLTLDYDRDEEALLLDEGRISPVPPKAWDFEAGGVRVLEQWFTARVTEPEPGTLSAIRPATWPQPWTSELLELITVLALLADLQPLQDEQVTRLVVPAFQARLIGWGRLGGGHQATVPPRPLRSRSLHKSHGPEM
jgi:hypothetical protein